MIISWNTEGVGNQGQRNKAGSGAWCCHHSNFEHINVVGMTFDYSADGVPIGLCKAKKLYYITTSGGDFAPDEYGYEGTTYKVIRRRVQKGNAKLTDS